MYPEESTPLRRLPSNVDERLSNERIWTELSANAHLPAEDLIGWLSLRSTHRFLAFRGKQLFLWRLDGEQPTIVNCYEIDDLQIDLDDGLTCTLFDNEDRELSVRHTPERLAEGVFLWMPYYNDVQYVKRKNSNDFGTYFSMMVRMPRNPSLKTKGMLHLSERKSFLELWPDFDLRGHI